METVLKEEINFPEFRQLLNKGIYTDKAACAEMDVSDGSIYRWLRSESPSYPNKENEGKVIKFMNKLRLPESKRPVKHPSYGWATPEQMKRLSELGLCPERDMLFETIKQQTKKKGKR